MPSTHAASIVAGSRSIAFQAVQTIADAGGDDTLAAVVATAKTDIRTEAGFVAQAEQADDAEWANHAAGRAAWHAALAAVAAAVAAAPIRPEIDASIRALLDRARG